MVSNASPRLNNAVPHLIKSHSENMLPKDEDDSDDSLPDEDHFEYDVPNSDEGKEEKVVIPTQTPKGLACLFTKMKTLNETNKDRLRRLPVWNWEDEKEHPDPLETGKLRVLAITWNMNAKKPPKDLSEFLRMDITHDLYIISSQE